MSVVTVSVVGWIDMNHTNQLMNVSIKANPFRTVVCSWKQEHELSCAYFQLQAGITERFKVLRKQFSTSTKYIYFSISIIKSQLT